MFGAKCSRSPFLLGSALCLLAGCPDPAGKYDEFVARVKKEPVVIADAGSDGCPIPEGGLPDPMQLSGTFLFSVSTTLGPLTPLVYLLEVEATRDADDVYTISMRDQPLSKLDRKTPVGEFGDPRVFVVSPAGCFKSDFVVFNIPAEVNPVLNSPTVAEIAFSGNVAEAVLQEDGDKLVTFWCGQVDGNVTMPLNLGIDGSTFTASRVLDPKNLPEVLIDCDMTPAREL